MHKKISWNWTNFMNKIPFFCINLSSRIDRWRKIKQEFSKANILVSRFPAVEIDMYPFFGCTQSHRLIIQKAHESWFNMVGVFEDDIFFYKPGSFLNKVEEIILNLPNDWRILYFWGLLGRDAKLRKINQFSYQVNNLMCTYGMIYHSRSYNEILDNLPIKKTEDKITIWETFIWEYQQYDCWLAKKYQIQYPCFVSHDFLVAERPDFSDIEWKQKNVGKKYLLRFRIYKYGFWCAMRLAGKIGDILGISNRKKSNY